MLRELVQSLAKVTFLLKHSVKLHHCVLCGDVAACREMTCVLYAQQTAHRPFYNMLTHLYTIYNGTILLNVLTEV